MISTRIMIATAAHAAVAVVMTPLTNLRREVRSIMLNVPGGPNVPGHSQDEELCNGVDDKRNQK